MVHGRCGVLTRKPWRLAPLPGEVVHKPQMVEDTKGIHILEQPLSDTIHINPIVMEQAHLPDFTNHVPIFVGEDFDESNEQQLMEKQMRSEAFIPKVFVPLQIFFCVSV
jgi:hypothetical protein